MLPLSRLMLRSIMNSETYLVSMLKNGVVGVLISCGFDHEELHRFDI